MGDNMLLTIGGIILLSTFVLYANGLLFDNSKLAMENEYIITAIALAQSVLDEAKTKAFDENTRVTPVTSPSALTPPNALGTDGAAEAVPVPDTVNSGVALAFSRFNDIDDYNNYIRVVNTPRAEHYNVQVGIAYASTTYPDSTRAAQTFCKKMTVTVTSPFIPKPITLSYAFAY